MNVSTLIGVCEGCDHGVLEAITHEDWLLCRADMLPPGTVVQCPVCNCSGWIDGDEFGHYVAWPNDICDMCKRHFDRLLDDVTARVLEMLKEG